MAVLVAIGGLLLVRHVLVLPLVANLLPHRVLVLGTGPEARLVEASLSAANLPGMSLVGFYALERCTTSAVSPQRVIARGRAARADAVRQLARSTKSSSPCASSAAACCRCARCSNAGWTACEVTDLARFFERVHGQVPIESLKASWLIYGNGFRQDWRAHVREAHVRRRRGSVPARPDAAGHGDGGAADRCRERRPGHLPPGARRRSRRDVHAAQVPQHAHDAEEGGKASWAVVQRSARHAASGGSSGARASTSCRSCSTCCAAR